jgi:hypothetical protein
MTCLVLGADKIGNLEQKLKGKGVDAKKVIHWNGRERIESIPSKVKLIIVLTGFVNHQAASKIKILAKKRDIPVIYLSRGMCELTTHIANIS